MKDSFSLDGWSFKSWLKGNLKTIKEIVKVATPLFISWSATQDPALVSLLTAFGKLVLDSAEYYVKSR